MRVESIESQGHARAVEPCGAGGLGAAGRLRLPHDATGFRALSRTGRRPAMWLLLPLVALLSLQSAVAQAQRPGVAVNDASGEEGNAGTTTQMEFTVTLTHASEAAVSVVYQTNATARPNEPGAQPVHDYLRDGGKVRFEPGETEKTISITVLGDNIDEGDYEYFWVVLSHPSNAWMKRFQAEGRILDDDNPTVTLTLSRDTVGENGEVVTVTASSDIGSVADMWIDVSLTPVSPTVAGDYTLSENTTLRIPATGKWDQAVNLQSEGTVTITTVNNDVRVPNKKVTVSATVRNDIRSIDPPAERDADDQRRRRYGASGDVCQRQDGDRGRFGRDDHGFRGGADAGDDASGTSMPPTARCPPHAPSPPRCSSSPSSAATRTANMTHRLDIRSCGAGTNASPSPPSAIGSPSGGAKERVLSSTSSGYRAALGMTKDIRWLVG